jgi:hypothetical protein
MGEDKITILNNWKFGCNRCLICDSKYRHSKVITEYEDGLQEVELRYSHPRCIAVEKKLKLLREKTMDAEFEFFNLKFNKYNQ